MKGAPKAGRLSLYIDKRMDYDDAETFRIEWGGVEVYHVVGLQIEEMGTLFSAVGALFSNATEALKDWHSRGIPLEPHSMSILLVNLDRISGDTLKVKFPGYQVLAFLNPEAKLAVANANVDLHFVGTVEDEEIPKERMALLNDVAVYRPIPTAIQ